MDILLGDRQERKYLSLKKEDWQPGKNTGNPINLASGFVQISGFSQRLQPSNPQRLGASRRGQGDRHQEDLEPVPVFQQLTFPLPVA